jgi:hypothetical protein
LQTPTAAGGTIAARESANHLSSDHAHIAFATTTRMSDITQYRVKQNKKLKRSVEDEVQIAPRLGNS